MKPHTLPVKRRPVPKGILKRLSAVTGNRKQRVAATATADMEAEDNSSKISRALTIIFLIHIVAIALIFVHQKFLDGRAPEQEASAAPSETAAAVAPVRQENLPKMSPSDKPYIVRAGDNYTRIATALQVDEAELRLLNQHMEIAPGRFLKVPAQRVVPQPATVETAPAATEVLNSLDGLVDNVDVSDAPRAQLVRPNTQPVAAPVPSASSGKTYVVQNGDSIWRIANRFKVNQDALMKANGIKDATRMKVGMNLVIP